MALSEAECLLLSEAGTTPDLTRRRQATGIFLRCAREDRSAARGLLVSGYVQAIQPSFHLVPHGTKMLTEAAFDAAYSALAGSTNQFRDVSAATLLGALTTMPQSLVPLRTVLSLTRNELSYTIQMAHPDTPVSDSLLKSLEQAEPPLPEHALKALSVVAEVAMQVMDRELLIVPPVAGALFHSKLDHPDTRRGWDSVRQIAADGVPYPSLLYQRYVGGSWRQAQDTYSEVKGDAVLELPIVEWLRARHVPFYHSAPGATGAAKTAASFHLDPGPDFVLPPSSPTLVIESKVAEDGGTVRDKAARIKSLAEAARSQGLAVCAVIDGKGWSQRPGSLADVIVATEGRTYTLQTLNYLENVPEVAALIGTATQEQ